MKTVSLNQVSGFSFRAAARQGAAFIASHDLSIAVISSIVAYFGVIIESDKVIFTGAFVAMAAIHHITKGGENND